MADTASTSTYTVTVDGIGPVPVTVTQRGEGRPFLLLHGGAGSQSVDGFAELLSTAEPARVLTPLHPGFGGTPRPEGLDSMPGLAKLYVQLIGDLGLTGVTVIGNSIGGWIAAEIALLGSPRVSDVILVDAGGLRIEDHPARRLLLPDHGPGRGAELLPAGRVPDRPGQHAGRAEGDHGRQPGRAGHLRRAGDGRCQPARPSAVHHRARAGGVGSGRRDVPARAWPGLRRGHPGRRAPR